MYNENSFVKLFSNQEEFEILIVKISNFEDKTGNVNIIFGHQD